MALAAGFPAVDRSRWMADVARVLARGKGDLSAEELRELFDRRLRTRTPDGLILEPLYTAEDAPPAGAEGLPGFAPYVRGAHPVPPAHGWDVRQIVEVEGDGAAAAGRAVHELENGAVSVLLDLERAGAPDVALLDRALDGVELDAVAIGLRAGYRAVAAAWALIALWAERGVAPERARASLGADPIGEHASAGGARGPVREALAEAVALATEVAASHPGAATFTADAARYHNAGATDAQQLAYALATGVAYLRALDEAGLPPDRAAAQIEFRLAAGPEQFPAIAAFRAFRRLWARVTEVAAGRPLPARVHAISSRAMTSRYDPWVNLLRQTVACFSAGVGGAEVVTIEPYDIACAEHPGALGTRLARNTQALLIEESGLGRVADPAGGSWFVERLTDQLAQAAWEVFQVTERAGGIIAALDAGAVQRDVEAAWNRRREEIAHRRAPLTGVSEFPDINEPAPGSPAAVAEPAGAPTTVPLVPRRYAEPFEEQRARADRHAAATGTRPAVFLACLGTPADHIARSTFAKNLFEAAGIRAIEGEDPGDDAALADAFARSGAALACICSSDAVYADRAAAAARALAGAGAARIYLAGRPDTALRDELEEAGVHEFAAAGGDALDLLTRALDAAGVGA